ncbi:hypothetical protein CBR_g54447 [Chara braunii]|uniref:DNA2/NAM7 helicase helicase domain-containing protein n=1 Tax=Chara braunii TaxID=69332 RepID=A0A388MC57_CHABU|nr:hypothetical protein CBR_g54447 [Chara braunii]|eukprot:GBG92146.1 hypothetical protein CBR_g54447 [Chara braunii]
MLAITEAHEGKQILRLRLYLGDDSEGDNLALIKASQARINRIRRSVTKANSPFWMLKLCNLSTISREYRALHSVHALPFAESIISATAVLSDSRSGSGGPTMKWNIPVPLMECLEESHNSSQFQAIQAGLSRAPVVLIQGPPGTGKTQTILGLLSVVLHATPVHQSSDR